MLNQNLKLNTKVWNIDVEKKSTRLGFGEGLLEAAITNDKIVAVSIGTVNSSLCLLIIINVNTTLSSHDFIPPN